MTPARPSPVSHAGRKLGKSPLSTSPLAWGMWRLTGDDVAAARRLVETALEAGFFLLDTADVYGADGPGGFGSAEALLGRVIAEAPSLRDRMVLGSKGGIDIATPYNSRADALVRACEASLKRLNTERIDLYQIHRPDLLAHPAETAAALSALRKAGKIAEAGVSNHTAAQTRALMAHLDHPLAAIQPEFSPLAIAALEDGVLDLALETGAGVLAWSPLGGGRIGAPGDERAHRVVGELTRVGRAHGVSPAVAAYAWILRHPARPVPIVGTQRPERIREAAAAVGFEMDARDWYAVLVAARGSPMP